jgi:hypothetical protein
MMSYLILLQPLLQELLPALLKDRASKLNRLEMVKLALLEEDTKVLQNGRKTTGRCRGSLNRLNNLCCTQNSLARICESLEHETEKRKSYSWGVSSNFRCFAILTALE